MVTTNLSDDEGTSDY
uniref:Uncharacterized protein n=1 Tax=Arundo donax TaxID=35708 RepID=A0A0A8ZUZ7_ARUDO